MNLSSRLIVALVASLPLPAQQPKHFEAPQTHPIARTPDGLRLVAAHSGNHQLAVYSLGDVDRPVLVDTIRVGLEPVAARPRNNDEVWVVNWLSDSVSIVSLEQRRVVATIDVGDEPGDVAFAGNYAFVTAATDRRVEVFDVTTRQKVRDIPVFGDEPRYLTASRDERTVYVVVLRSGNGTTIVPDSIAPPQPPPTKQGLPTPPRVGLIVKSDDPTWKNRLKVDLPDYDVIELDVASQTVRRSHRAVGTINFAAAQRPGRDELWVANTEARNLVRFEPALRGHFIDSRVTRIDLGAQGTVTPFDLNPQIDYRVLPNPAALATALSQPTGLEFSPDGRELFVAAFGSDRIGVVDPQNGQVTARIEVGPVRGTRVDSRNMRGPRGMAHHPTQKRLYVLNRLGGTISVIDTQARRELREVPMPFDPMSTALREGRGFLYDAKRSGNGTASCAACHIDGDHDGLAWDLGDPGGDMVRVRTQFGGTENLHPMKGPMTTQTLRGLLQKAPLHWRGDKTRFQDFNSAFDKLMGGAQVSRQDMDAYAAFVDSIVFPPNPHRNLDDSLPTTPAGTSPAEGEVSYRTRPFRAGVRCNDCHAISGGGTNRLIISSTVLQEPQAFKVPQLRNVYKRLGRRPTAQGRTSGFGILHDGSKDDVFDLLSLPVFGPLARDAREKTKLQNFVLAFPTGTKPMVGHALEVTRANANDPAVVQRAALMRLRCRLGDCDLVAVGNYAGRRTGFFYNALFDRFDADRVGVGPFTLAQLRQEIVAGRAELTLRAVVGGTGARTMLDLDQDGRLDGDELARPYGASTASCAGAPTLAANDEARAGNTEFALVARGFDANANLVTLVGAASASTPVLGITLRVAAPGMVLIAGTTDARGEFARRLPIPNGTPTGAFYAQAVGVSSCGPMGLAATPGLEVPVTAR